MCNFNGLKEQNKIVTINLFTKVLVLVFCFDIKFKKVFGTQKQGMKMNILFPFLIFSEWK